MSLIKCDECGREISSHSLFCPGCGYPTHLNSALTDHTEPKQFTVLKEVIETTVVPELPEPTAVAEPEPVAVAEAAEERQPTPAETTEAAEKEEPQETEETAETSEAVAEYEASLEGGRDHRRRNERMKVFLFLGVFLTLLGVVLYFYFTSPIEQIGEEAEEETVAEEIEAVTDSVAAAPDTVPAANPDTTWSAKPAAVPAPAAAGTAKPAPASAAGSQTTSDTREIRVAPLSTQASHASRPEPADAE